MAVIRCTTCQKEYPAQGTPYLCRDCGGVFDFDAPPIFQASLADQSLPGMWRYKSTFDLFPGAPVVSLGEGNTPLVWDQFGQVDVGLKMESLNPSGSYKDRGTAVLVSQLLARGIRQAVEDSSGNAGASFAAYAARAGLKGKVFVPEAASGPKRTQIEKYGAELVRVPGPRSAAAAAVLQDVANGATYASHAYMPFGLAGIATIAYEIWETLKGAPGTIITPVGHGGLLLGLQRGFAALKNAGKVSGLPYWVGVQAAACAPCWEAYRHKDLPAMDSAWEDVTVAEGVRVRKPVRASAILKEIFSTGGEILAIEEQEILPAYHELARRGFYVEPTSALVLCALNKLSAQLPKPVVMVISGSGLKYEPD